VQSCRHISANTRRNGDASTRSGYANTSENGKHVGESRIVQLNLNSSDSGGGETVRKSGRTTRRGTRSMERTGTRKTSQRDASNQAKRTSESVVRSSNSSWPGDGNIIGKIVTVFAPASRNNGGQIRTDSGRSTMRGTGAIPRREDINRELPEPGEVASLAISLWSSGRLYSGGFNSGVFIVRRD